MKRFYKNYELILNNINEYTRSYKILKDIEDIVEIKKTICVKINIPDTYDEYYMNLKKKYRDKIKYYYNRLKKDKKEILFEYKLEHEINEELSKALYDVYKKRQEFKGRISNINKIIDYINKLFKLNKDEVTLAIKNNSEKFIAVAYIDNKISAQLIGFIHNNSIVIPRIAINPEFSKYSPGTLLISNTMEYICENKKYKVMDLTRGNEKYKYDYGGIEHYNYSFKV